MRKLRAILLITCLALFGVAASYADSVTEYFNLTCPGGNCGPGQNAPTVVSAVGEVTFTLNLDGTIAASLWDYGPATVYGFGFNSCFCNSPDGRLEHQTTFLAGATISGTSIQASAPTTRLVSHCRNPGPSTERTHRSGTC